MRHRKKLIFATLFVLAAYATVCFWPHSNPEAVRALAIMRGMVEFPEDAGKPMPADGPADEDVQIEVSVVIAKVNMTDATAGLLAELGRLSDQARVGRTKSVEAFLHAVQSTSAIAIEGMPRIMALPGQRAAAVVGSNVPVTLAAANAAAPAVIGYADVGTSLSVTARIADGSNVMLDLDCQFSQVVGLKVVATAAGMTQAPELRVVAAKGRAALQSGETLVLAGLSHKQRERSIFKLPGLGDLPGIGGWMRFEREREIEEELIILATPRIVTPAVANGR